MASVPRADAAAASVGAADLFVLRRITGNRFVHFGGSGRGSGWAGLIEVATSEEASLREALSTRRPRREGARVRPVLRARSGFRAGDERRRRRLRQRRKRARRRDRREPRV